MELGIQDHLICLLEACMQFKKQQIEPDMAWFQIGKGLWQGCVLSSCLFNLYSEHTIWNARLYESQAGIKIVGRNINNFRYVDDTTLMTKTEEELKSLLRWKRRVKSMLKTKHSKNYDKAI